MVEHAELVTINDFADIPVTLLVQGFDENRHFYAGPCLNDIFYPKHHITFPKRSCAEFPEHVIGQHTNDGIEILCITKGSAYVTIGRQPTRLFHVGDIAIVNPFEEHELDGQGNYERICLTFMPDMLLKNTFGIQDLLVNLQSGKLCFDNFLDAESEAAQEICKLLDEMILVVSQKKQGWALALHGYIYACCYQLFSRGLYRIVQREQATTHVFMRTALAYLNTHSLSEVSCRAAAEYCGYSEAYFCRIFKKNFGETFVDYVNRYRIQSAKQIIDSSPSLSIVKVMELVGFSHSSYFSKMFKKIIGVSPSEYIESSKKRQQS